MLGQHEAGHVFQHRHFDHLAQAGLGSAEEGKADALRRDQPGDVVGHHHGHVARFADRALEGGGDAACGLDHRVIGRRFSIRPVRAEAQNGAGDEPGIGGAKPRRIQPQPGQRGGADIGDEDIGLRNHLPERPARGRDFQVDGQAALVAVELQERVPHAARYRRQRRAERIPRDGLHLDHIGAVIPQDLGRQRPHREGRHVEHPNAAERLCRQAHRNNNRFALSKSTRRKSPSSNFIVRAADTARARSSSG